MRHRIQHILALAAAFLVLSPAFAQEKFGGIVEFDSMIHDFGDVLISDGAVSHNFTVKNISSSPVTILTVISSCGCTDVEWTKGEIKPGAKGTISATYSNDEGPYPFDKTLTVYLDKSKQSAILHLRGSSVAKPVPLGESYPVKFGAFAMKSVELKGGNLSQGEQKSGQVKVANTSSKPIKVTFQDVSEGLSISVSPNPIPASQTATLSYNITSDRRHWGKNWYYATPVVDGKTYKAAGVTEEKKTSAGSEAMLSDPNPNIGNGRSAFGVWATTKENFSSWSADQKKKGPTPVFESSNFSFGRIKAGKKVSAEFKFTNSGKSPLVIYKIESDCSRVNAVKPADTAAGAKGSVKVDFDTTALPKGEVLVLVNLTTNSPTRPLVTLYITGFIN